MNLLFYPNFLKNPLNLVRVIYSFICLLPFVKELHFKNFKGGEKAAFHVFLLANSIISLFIHLYIHFCFFLLEREYSVMDMSAKRVNKLENYDQGSEGTVMEIIRINVVFVIEH